MRQKSKLHWLDVGDKNNKTFHRAAKIREMRNSIREIQCSNGEVVSTQEEIKEEATSYFAEFLRHVPTDFYGASIEELSTLLDFKCSDINQSMLVRDITENEIKEVVFSMLDNKSSGPDGYTSEFFKTSWAIIHSDFVVGIQSFFQKGFLPKGINSTILALIPKRDGVREMKDYRPISCCNVIYKVISKILANRMRLILPTIIAANQSAFLKDRLLIENILLAMGLVKDYHKDTISSRCAIKIDISKAFDSI